MNYSRVNLDTASPDSPDSRILVIYTGGTFGMGHNESGSFIPFDFEDILDAIPSLKTYNIFLEVLSFEKPVDSSNIKPSHWLEIASIIYSNYETFDGFVVLHGTDTMAYTASAMSFILEGLEKPVIFTGAQLPLLVPRSDASENFITSIEIACARKNGKPIVNEVCIYFNYELIRGNRAKKVESIHFDAFQSENYPLLAKSGVSIEYNYPYLRESTGNKPLSICEHLCEEVAFVKLFPGISELSLSPVLQNASLKGIVLETFGNGNAPTDKWFIEQVKQTVDSGIVVLNVSQCLGGKVLQGRYETSQQLEEIGVISGRDITSEAAITKLMYLLGNYSEKNTINELLHSSLSGEITV